MTAKQKAAREKFKKVVAEASKLRKKNPKLTQAQAVKQAWAISYSKAGKSKKVGVVKKEKSWIDKEREKDKKKSIQVKKIINEKFKGWTWEIPPKSMYTDDWSVSKWTKWIKERGRKMGFTKKSAVAKKSTRVKAKKGKSTEMHTDTKSHNVNIRVVSGTRTLVDIQRDIDDIKWLTKRIKEYQDVIDYVKSIKPLDRTLMQKNALIRSEHGIKNLKEALTKIKRNLKV